ncbi:MAG: sensor domain-containing diguanylate cyclase [Candidatus Omnitrophota bacterium]|jgi:diguanylate cyclase (GGDEF)-like protein
MEEQEPFDSTEKLFTRTRSRRSLDWLRVFIFSLITGLFVIFFMSGTLTRLENMILDIFQRCGGLTQTDPRITLIEINEETMDEIGPWPWPRRYHAVMARLLDQWGAAAILFDFNFPGETDPKDDQDFVQVLASIRAPFYLPVEYRPQKDKKFWLHGLPVVFEKNEGKMVWGHSLQAIEKNARGLGHHFFKNDPDGILRRVDLRLSDGVEEFPYLGVLPAAVFSGDKSHKITELKLAEDENGCVLIPWLKDHGSQFTKCNFSEIIHSYYGIQKGMAPVLSPELIRGKICLVGLTSQSQTLVPMTPLGSETSSLAAHAQVMNAALTGQWIRLVSRFSNLIFLVLVGLMAGLLFMILRGAMSLLAGLFLAVGWVVFAFMVFKYLHLWIFSAHQLLLILTLFVFSAIYVQITAARDRSVLFHLATRDGLTGLYVIRHFRLIMNQIVREVTFRKEPLSIILIDIDHFKNINDTYGHPAGDMILKKVAHTLAAYIRKKRPFSQVDFAARYGGEEFIIMLRKSGLREAVEQVAERLREKVASTRFEWEGKSVQVTISLGVATLRPGENVPDPMVRRADAALYRAKAQGRNRVCSE